MSMDLETLARRAVACPAWRWMPGMREHGYHHLIVSVTAHYVVEIWQPGLSGTTPFHVETWLLPPHNHGYQRIPDLADPATLGCMADIVQSHLAGLANRDAACYHGLRVAGAWQDWLMGHEDRRAVAMVEALEVGR